MRRALGGVIMNCLECREMLAAHLEGVLEDSAEDFARHVSECAACQAELAQTSELHERLRSDGRASVEAGIGQAVMDRIFRTTTDQLRRKTMIQRVIRIGAGLSVAAALAVVAVLLFVPANPPLASAAEILANGAKAAANLKSVHIVARMRSQPREDIEFIAADSDFIPIEMWKQFEPIAKWRVEKPGRVIVMDGKQFVTWVKPDFAFRHGAIDNSSAFWIAQLLDVDRILEIERKQAAESKAKLTTSEERSADGKRHLVVTIEAKARGDFSASDWMKNKTLSQSDHRRVYRFNAENNRLEGVDVWVQGDGKDVLIFQITSIEYDPKLDDSLFVLNLPKDVRWLNETKPSPQDKKYAQMTPKEIAKAFFDALAQENWDEVNKLYGIKIDDKLRGFGGLKVVTLGEPFQSGLFPGWFIPYEVQLKSGKMLKYNLAVRNDNEQKRWKVDGGL
jgi:outer membrane lipoprotein-sorting protein